MFLNIYTRTFVITYHSVYHLGICDAHARNLPENLQSSRFKECIKSRAFVKSHKAACITEM